MTEVVVSRSISKYFGQSSNISAPAPFFGVAAKGLTRFSQAAPGDSVIANAVKSAVVGGVASELGGGKFANGAQTAAFGYLFNDVLTGTINVQIPSALGRLLNSDGVSANGFSISILASVPGRYGGERDLGLAVTPTIGESYRLGAVVEGTYTAGSVRDVVDGIVIRASDGFGGVTGVFDTHLNPLGAGIHVGPSGGVSATYELPQVFSLRQFFQNSFERILGNPQ